MPFEFSKDDLSRIGEVLGVEPRTEGSTIRYELQDEASGRTLALEIVVQMELPGGAEDRPANLISTITTNSFLQLHGCTGYLASSELQEVIFFARQENATSGLVVERGAGCTIYANVDDRLLSTDFRQLPPELMMSSVALSLTDSLLDDL